MIIEYLIGLLIIACAIIYPILFNKFWYKNETSSFIDIVIMAYATLFLIFAIIIFPFLIGNAFLHSLNLN